MAGDEAANGEREKSAASMRRQKYHRIFTSSLAASPSKIAALYQLRRHRRGSAIA